MTNKQQKDLMYIIIGMALLPILLPLKALVFMKYYEWFLCTNFEELPTIDFWSWVGISLFISLLFNYFKNENSKEDDSSIGMKLAKVIMKPLIHLLFGWIIFKFLY